MEAAKPGTLQWSAGAWDLVRPRVVVPVLTALAAGLGVLHLRYRSIFLEETLGVARAHGSWTNIWHTATGGDPNASLFYAALKAWTGVFGDGLVAVRSLSVVCAALIVPVVYAIGARLFGAYGGMAAALLVAINAYLLQWAQVARGYTLVTLLATVAWYFFLVELERPGWRTELGYVASSALAFYAHYYAAWLTLVQLLVLVSVHRRAALSRPWVLCYAAIAVLIAPMVTRAATLDHNPLGWLQSPHARALWDISAELSGDSMRILVGILCTCVLVLVAGTWSPRLRFGLTVTAAWVVLPLFGAFAVSQFKPILANNYLLVCVPGLALFTGGALTGLRSRAVAVAVLVWLVVVSGPPLRTWYRYQGREGWRDAVAYVEHHRRSGDGIVFRAPIAAVSFREHADRDSVPTRLRFAPDAPWRSLSTAANPRLWVVLAYREVYPDQIRSGLAPSFAFARTRRFEGVPGNWPITVELFVKRRST